MEKQQSLSGQARIVLIDKELVKRLASLAKIELQPGEENKLAHDLEEILEYVHMLDSLDTAGVPPMNGGTDLKNITRGDKERQGTNQGQGLDSFPENNGGYLKAPYVFE